MTSRNESTGERRGVNPEIKTSTVIVACVHALAAAPASSLNYCVLCTQSRRKQRELLGLPLGLLNLAEDQT